MANRLQFNLPAVFVLTAVWSKTTRFTLCGTMTLPVRLGDDLGGTIDLLGPPW